MQVRFHQTVYQKRFGFGSDKTCREMKDTHFRRRVESRQISPSKQRPLDDPRANHGAACPTAKYPDRL
jgi:hypothetical protein